MTESDDSVIDAGLCACGKTTFASDVTVALESRGGLVSSGTPGNQEGLTKSSGRALASIVDLLSGMSDSGMDIGMGRPNVCWYVSNSVSTLPRLGALNTTELLLEGVCELNRDSSVFSSNSLKLLGVGLPTVAMVLSTLSRSSFTVSMERDEAPSPVERLAESAALTCNATADPGSRSRRFVKCRKLRLVLFDLPSSLAVAAPPESGRLAKLGTSSVMTADCGCQCEALPLDGVTSAANKSLRELVPPFRTLGPEVHIASSPDNTSCRYTETAASARASSPLVARGVGAGSSKAKRLGMRWICCMCWSECSTESGALGPSTRPISMRVDSLDADDARRRSRSLLAAG